MNLATGQFGLAIGFLIIFSVLLWLLIHSRGGTISKALLVFATVWYAVVIFYSARDVMGWPTSQHVPENSRLLAVRIMEPVRQQNHPGAIFLWVSIDPEEEGARRQGEWKLIPDGLLSGQDRTEPRAYKLPYSREMHESIVAAQNEAKEIPGAQMKVRNGKDKEGEGAGAESANLEFEIVNPMRLFPKDS